MNERSARKLLQFGIVVFGLIVNIAAFGADHPGLFKPNIASATQAEITLSIGALAAGQHWTVLLEPQSGSSTYAVAPGYVIPMDTTRSGELPADSIGVLPATLYTLKDSEFHISDMTEIAKSVFLVSQTPLGKTVNVIFQGKLVYRAKVSATTLLVDGNVAPDPSAGRAKVLQFLVSPALIADSFGADLNEDTQGGWLATTAGLRRHLQTLPAISGSLEGQRFPYANGQAAAVGARIQIDTTGKVTEVHIYIGDDPLAGAVKSALAKAQFTPFMLNGKAITVEGKVTYTLNNDGEPPLVSIAGN